MKNKPLDLNKKLKRVKIIIFTLLLLLALRIIFGGVIQQLEFYSYEIQGDRYFLTMAEIYEKQDISLRFGELKLVPILKVKMRYEANGRMINNQRILLFADCNIDDTELIAVNIKNENKIKRCNPYPTWYDGVDIVFWMCFYLLFRRMLYIETIIKKSYIKKHISKGRVTKRVLKKLIKSLAKMGIQFNEQTLWLITHYGRSQEMAAILNILPLILEGNFFEYNGKMHAKGLPDSFYVLAEQDEKYYCCCEDSEWLYQYSIRTGIAPSEYETIYDYIVEQIGCNEKAGTK